MPPDNALVNARQLLHLSASSSSARTARVTIRKSSIPASVLTRAQGSLGLMYIEEKGVPQDYTQAAFWVGKAAEQSVVPSQSLLGYLYGKGLGVPQDHTQAVAWYRKAADQGYAEAQSATGRDCAFLAIENALSSDRGLIAVRAVKSLSRVLGGFLPGLRSPEPAEIEWQNRERFQVLDILDRRLSAPVDEFLAREMRTTLEPFLDAVTVAGLSERVRSILQRIPRDDEDILDALCVPNWDRFNAEEKRDISAPISVLRHKFPEPLAQIEELVRLLDGLSQHGQGAQNIDAFFYVWCEDAACCDALVEHILSSPQSTVLTLALPQGLRRVRERSLAQFLVQMERTMSHQNLAIIRSATWLMVNLDLRHPSTEDISVLERMAVIPDWQVRHASFLALQRMGSNSNYRSQTLDLLLRIDLNDDLSVKGFCERFSPWGIKTEGLAPNAVDRILAKLFPIKRLDAHGLGDLLTNLAHEHPDRVLRFLIARIEEAGQRRARNEWDYWPIPSDIRKPSLRSVSDEKRKGFLDDVAMLLKSRSEEDLTQGEYSETFWLVGSFDGVTVSVLEQFLVDERAALQSLTSVLSHAPRSFVFSHQQFCEVFLNLCSSVDPDLLKHARGVLITNAHPSSWSGSFGQPSPVWTSLRDKATTEASKHPQGSQMYTLFVNIGESAAEMLRREELDFADFTSE